MVVPVEAAASDRNINVKKEEELIKKLRRKKCSRRKQKLSTRKMAQEGSKSA